MIHHRYARVLFDLFSLAELRDMKIFLSPDNIRFLIVILGRLALPGWLWPSVKNGVDKVTLEYQVVIQILAYNFLLVRVVAGLHHFMNVKLLK